jgi:hypothetical protein
MLEAFGKGASEDMHKAKEALYQQVCYCRACSARTSKITSNNFVLFALTTALADLQLTWDGVRSRCVPLEGAHETSVFMSEPASPVYPR